VGLALAREADALCLTVTDAGPGFEPQILATLGEPYRSTRQRPGGGLGLYLVHNVVRRLGGTLQARNRPEGGAEVTIRLPLAAITLPAGPHATR
jgi:two-component system sensor histidine kinase RegB